MKGAVILLNIFLFALVFSECMKDLGTHTISDLPLFILGIVCLLSTLFLAAGEKEGGSPFARKTAIVLNLSACAFAVMGMMVDTEGRMDESLMLILILISLFNAHVLVVGKKDWSDTLLEHSFFARGRVLKAVILPIVFVTFLLIPTDLNGYREAWQNIKGYAYFKYDPDWTGVYITNIKDDPSDNFGIIHPSRFVNRGFKGKEECIAGEPDFGSFENPNNIYVCGKKCLYNDFGYGFCLKRD